MTVGQFEREYKKLQDEGMTLYKELKPLLARLQKLATKGVLLEQKANLDSNLYEIDRWDTLGWSIGVLLRLDELGWLKEEGIEGIKNCLLNLRDQKFWKKRISGKRK